MATLGGSHRSAGVDVARAIALLGIMAVHIFPRLTEDGHPHPAFLLDSGRAPALFPVLAGVGLALAHGGRMPPCGLQLWAGRAGIAARAALLVVIGLLLGRVDSPPLVILVHFGLMFLVATFFLGVGARALLAIAALWILLVPQLSYVVRTGPAGTAGSPQLPEPAGFLQPLVDIALASSYPVLAWTGYVLIGLAIGRLGIETKKDALRLVLVGLAVAILATSLSALLLALAGGPDRLVAHTEGLTLVTQDMPTQLAVGLYGTTPTTDVGWLLVSAPHSSTTFDLLHTGGAAVAVLGLCLLLVRQVARRARLPLVAVGSMTLTLYTVHVASLWTDGPFFGQDAAPHYVGQVAVALVLALLWRSVVGRGPLEALAAVLDRWARAGLLAAVLLARREPALPEAPDRLRT